MLSDVNETQLSSPYTTDCCCIIFGGDFGPLILRREGERKRDTTASTSSVPTDNEVGETEQELKTHFFIWV